MSGELVKRFVYDQSLPSVDDRWRELRLRLQGGERLTLTDAKGRVVGYAEAADTDRQAWPDYEIIATFTVPPHNDEAPATHEG